MHSETLFEYVRIDTINDIDALVEREETLKRTIAAAYHAVEENIRTLKMRREQIRTVSTATVAA